MDIQNYAYLNQPPRLLESFFTLGNIHFQAEQLLRTDPVTQTALLAYGRYERKGRFSFNNYSAPFEAAESWSFPPSYPDRPAFPLQLAFTAPNVLRLRTTCDNLWACRRAADWTPARQTAWESHWEQRDNHSLMLAGQPQPLPQTASQTADGSLSLKTAAGSVEIQADPFHLILRDQNGRVLTHTLHRRDSMNLQNCSPLPCSYLQQASDLSRYPLLALQLYPGEAIYGCGESFTRLNKRGQRLDLWTRDPHGVETEGQYKPVPFYLSSRGYGVFYHTSAPLTLDFGHSYAEAQQAVIGEAMLEVFFFFGTPKEILRAYTDLTGHSPVPPFWSFGLWMSRISYKSEAEVRAVSARLRQEQIPCDVIHLDTGWFERDWCCDYRFSPSRFADPAGMLQQLRQQDHHRVSLWQLPYFTPDNPLYPELLHQKLALRDANGHLAGADAILDFSDPAAVRWYEARLAELLRQGVAAIKADFGEAAPLDAVYHAGHSGWLEHNLYPLRYNKAAYEACQHLANDGQGSLIWARSAWAGSQRYPVHWGGDAENTDMGLLCTLRAGLSLGLSGFTFWSHDLGGFVKPSPEDLYLRWTFMGVFSSHLRCHGAPPKEPWAYSPAFLQAFRRLMQLRYRLLPYIYEQSQIAATAGLPLLRALWLEYPEDMAVRDLEDEYLFGQDLLVAPLLTAERCRQVYLPRGQWVNWESGEELNGGCWSEQQARDLPGLLWVRSGAEIPLVQPALSTDEIDWSTLTRCRFGEATPTPAGEADGARPGETGRDNGQ
ncbi:glycoside hydrolase family 31 protein [Oscillospiraceae bacterium HV4-5-C5C]|nr:glycoside hydrolase family 31 protein [Oscillospiraceae bacterium]MDD4367882.1 glycoside hydrolase family 31 protein [Oscillospiraceae bacterium]NJP40640.1 glycoside hydrolase family 31 protein [Oscillospiraceae bacterium HV4-5-C5C]